LCFVGSGCDFVPGLGCVPMDSESEAATEASVGDFHEDAYKRGREPYAKLIFSSWVVNMAHESIEDSDDEPWFVRLPQKERAKITWTKADKFMNMDGIMEAYTETGARPLESHCVRRRTPLRTFRSAKLENVEEVPDGCRLATVGFFNDNFFRNHLTGWIRDPQSMLTWVKFLSQPKVTVRATHVVARKIVCPAHDGPELIEWLHHVFAGLQAKRYSPNGEEKHLIDQGVDHASMTIGDFVKIGDVLYIVGLDGFYASNVKAKDLAVVPLQDFFAEPTASKAGKEQDDDLTDDLTDFPPQQNATEAPAAREIQESGPSSSWQTPALPLPQTSQAHPGRPAHWPTHRPLDRRPLRTQLARARAAFKAAQRH